MPSTTHQKSYMESLRISNLPAWGNKNPEMVNKLSYLMTSRGYCVARNSHSWMIATHPTSDRSVQIELTGGVVDFILLDEDTARCGNGFPLGGGWFTKDTAFLDEENFDFIMKKVDAMFDLDTRDYTNPRR